LAESQSSNFHLEETDMMKRILAAVALAALVVALTPTVVEAYGAAHVGYTHVGPNGAYHTGATAVRGPEGGVYAGGHTTAVGGYGPTYHPGGTIPAGGYGYGTAHYGGTAYAPGYHAAAGGYAYIR
jgi:hypothetical protein